VDASLKILTGSTPSDFGIYTSAPTLIFGATTDSESCSITEIKLERLSGTSSTATATPAALVDNVAWTGPLGAFASVTYVGRTGTGAATLGAQPAVKVTFTETGLYRITAKNALGATVTSVFEWK